LKSVILDYSGVIKGGKIWKV